MGTPINESAGDTQLPGGSALRSKFLSKIGILLILLSGVFFFSMLSVPWWPLSGGSKALVGGTLFVSVQVAWWVGAALVGPAALTAMKSWLAKK